MLPLLSRFYDRGVAEPEPSRQGRHADCGRPASRDERRTLHGVSAYILVEPPDAAAVIETVRAFGGRGARRVEEATHVIVADELGATELQRYHAYLQSSLAENKPVVGVSWLEEVVGSAGKSPWDQALLDSHMPPVLADLARPRRRTDTNPLAGSLQETWQFLKREHPDQVEAGQLRVAIERSLLDCALTLRRDRRGGANQPREAPEQILGVAQGARPEEVRAAYREKAKTAHPDKGGDPESFCRLQQAYLALTGGGSGEGSSASRPVAGEALLALPVANAKDFELREHRTLVESWFEQHGADLAQHKMQQELALEALGLKVCDVGSVNRNERGEEMRNQCFYLSLARSYLGSDQKKHMLEETALHFKRVVESAVLAAHPDWGGSRVGEDVQAFSDFLFFVLGSHALLAELGVAVFDSVSGGVEIYRGKHYPGPEREEEQRSNLLMIRFVPGHYQALVPTAESRRPSLPELERCLEDIGVLYVITDG
mmetsp:Transcript_107624/g.299795  ORF Transcript_107624/g.299795 Transcript_107624/m.299795 type:complete len:487 (-) Transcript_107624:130-1590(-)